MPVIRPVPSLLAMLAVAVATASLYIAGVPAGVADHARSALRFDIAGPPPAAGDGVRLTVRVLDEHDRAVDAPVELLSARLDMGPDGMAAMAAPLRPVDAATPGEIVLDTDLAMAGRWALTLEARVSGHESPLAGVVEFTAEASPPPAAAPAGERRILYYRNPMGLADTSPVPKKDSMGMDYIPVYEEAAAPAGERRILYYRNPMGLADTSPVPKKDSMGMDYIPVYEEETRDVPGTVRVSVEKMQLAGVRTAPVERRSLRRTVRAYGTLAPDESRLATVSARFDGFVEELHVPLTGATVKAGTPLLRVWIESAEILQKQADHLLALKNAASRSDDVQRTAQNLRLFGLSDEAIATLRRSGTPVRSLTLVAPRDGTVLEKPVVVGMRFAAGETLYRTADLSVMWVMTRVAERDLGLVHAGQQARVIVNAFSDTPIEGRVDFVYPEVDPVTRTALVRVVLDNADGRLRTGLYADVDIDSVVGDGPVVAVPESAVIDSGRRQVVFVTRGDGVFEPRDVRLGRRGDEHVEVREGVAEGERVVVSGNFLIDAESNLRAALAAFAPAPAAEHATDHAAHGTAGERP